jgi:hypothetical protein
VLIILLNITVGFGQSYMSFYVIITFLLEIIFKTFLDGFLGKDIKTESLSKAVTEV